MAGAFVPVLCSYAFCRWRSAAARSIHGAVAAGAFGAFFLYAAAPALRAVLPLVPSLAPVRAALFYAALPEEALKLGALALVVRRQTLLVQAVGVACGFAAAENVLALWYAAQPMAMVVGRVTIALPAHLALAALAARILSSAGLSAWGFVLAFLVTVPVHALWDALFFAGWERTGDTVVAVAVMLAFLAWR